MKVVALGLFCTALLIQPAAARTACHDASAAHGRAFHMVWHDKGSGCLTLGASGAYRASWDLGQDGNLVAGRGWVRGNPNRIVRYRVRSFVPGSNGYVSLYGWSTDPLVEYYVVDDYGPFVPPGQGAVSLGSFESDGGTYKIYRTQRIDAPSIAGPATFYQYWSVRTKPRPIGKHNVITFVHHVNAWRAAGLPLGTLGYQIVATEGFGSRGRSSVEVTFR